MLEVHDKNRFNDDGTVRRKYESDGGGEGRVGLRVAFGLAIASAVSFVKNVVQATPGQPVAVPGDSETATSDRHGTAAPAQTSTASLEHAAESSEADEAPIDAGAGASGKVIRFPGPRSQDVGGTPRPNAAPSGQSGADVSSSPVVLQFAQLGTVASFVPAEGQLSFAAQGKVSLDRPIERTSANRRPTTLESVWLGTIFLNAHLAIEARALLSKSADPDGDPLTIKNLTVSSGELTLNADGSWHYLPVYNDPNQVVFRYQVSDGEFDTWQLAVLNFDSQASTSIEGTAGPDDLLGTAGADRISGHDGDAVLIGREGADVIIGGSGSDRIAAGDGNDVVWAGAGNDFVLGGSGDDAIYGEAGDDILHGEEGHDLVVGGEGNDQLFGDHGNDVLIGGSGADTIDGGADADTVDAGDGDDVILASGGDDVLAGGAGADTIAGGSGADTIDGGADADTVDAGDGDDVILASGGDDVLAGGAGADTIAGGSGADTIDGGADADTVDAGDGDDVILASGGDDIVEGGAGADTYDLSTVTDNLTIDLQTGRVESDGETDRLGGIENVHGGSGNDRIIAGDNRNELSGGDGDDVFVFVSSKAAGNGHQDRDRIRDFEVGDRIDIEKLVDEFDRGNENHRDLRFTLLNGENVQFTRPGELRISAYEEFEDGTSQLILDGNLDRDSDTEFQIEIAGDDDAIHDFLTSNFGRAAADQY